MNKIYTSPSIGHSHIRLSEIDSTNAFTQKLVSEQYIPEGTLITAAFQSQGRGQIGRYWYSSKGKNLLCSILLRPTFMKATDQFMLNMAVSLAVRDCIATYITHKNVYVKWPNDIYINEKKVAGILIQNTLKHASLSESIIGIGINVNEPVFPKELPNPTSIFIENKETLAIDDVSNTLCKSLEKYYTQVQVQETKGLKSEYISHLYKYNEAHRYSVDDEVVTGIIKHIEDDGKLVVLIDGKEKKFSFREISLLHENK